MQKFRFIKEYKCNEGVIPQNSEVQITNNVMYFNGGLVSSAYEKILEDIINKDDGEYVIEVPLIKNEF